MKKIVIGILAVVIGAGTYLYISFSNEVFENETNTVGGSMSKSESPELIFKLETVEAMYPGGVESIEYEVPYVTYDASDEVRIFDEPQARTDFSLQSPSGNYIYLSKGVGRQDAGVAAYVFDIQSRELHEVCVADENGCIKSLSFGGQHLLDVSWNESGILKIKYQNPGLVPDASESGPTIGLESFESISTGTPWVMEQVN